MATDRYTHGHHESVLRSHRWRTAENSAAYLLPRLVSGQTLLDVGCGPGTVTVDLARRLAPGLVVGLDAAAAVLEQAGERAASGGVGNVRFEMGDVYELAYPDESFDVVHAHQVLQHLTDPVRALRQMRRVLRTGGTLAVRDSDYGAFVWSPADPELDRWLELYHEVTTANGADADAGRKLYGWVRAAGFEDVVGGSSTWTFADDRSRAWWGDLWAERIVASDFAVQAQSYGLADAEELQAMSDAWRRWAAQPDGYFAVLHGEALATR